MESVLGDAAWKKLAGIVARKELASIKVVGTAIPLTSTMLVEKKLLPTK
jgi:hypothetical protein